MTDIEYTMAMTQTSVLEALLPVIILLVLLLGVAVFNGILCSRLARYKGYRGYFFTGFFLGVIGLIYVVGLPDLNLRKDFRAVMKRMVENYDRLTVSEDRSSYRA